MYSWFIFWAFFAAFYDFSSALKCGEVSPYDYLCTTLNETTVLVLSTSPCHSKATVRFTIMQTGPNPFFYSVKQDKSNKRAHMIQIGNSGYGAVLDFHEHDALHKDLHVSLYILKYRHGGGQDHHSVIDAYFKLNTAICQKFKHDDEGDPTLAFKKQSTCDESLRLGDYSTLCYRNTSGITLTFFNPCDVPYSTTVCILVPHANIEIIEKYYSVSPVDPIHVTIPGMSGEQAFRVTIHSAVNDTHDHLHDMQHVQITDLFGNPSGSEDRLIDDVYYPVFGMMCQETPCTKLQRDSQECNGTMTNFNDKSVIHSHIRIKLDLCSSDLIHANVSYIIHSSNQDIVIINGSIPSIDPFGSSLNDLHNFTLVDLRNGKVSLWATEDVKRNKIHVVLFTHLKGLINTFPVVHTDFYLNKKKICEEQQSNDSDENKDDNGMMRIVVPIVCVSFVLLLAVFVYWLYKRREMRMRRGGLPYQIELDDDYDLDNDENY